MIRELQTIKDVLVSVCENTYHYQAPEGSKLEKYIVWQEESEFARLMGDGDKMEVRLQGSIDLFTKTEYDPLTEQIEAAFKAAHIYIEHTWTHFEEDTGYIHYEWIWRYDGTV